MSDEYQSITVADARAAVQASGELAGFQGPEYWHPGDDKVGGMWLPMFIPAGEGAHPEFTRAIITRQGQAPREVVIAWNEYADQMDADPEWDAIRASKPMTIFGSEVERHAYRVVFADVLAPLLARRQDFQKPGDLQATAEGVVQVVVRDWSPEVANANAVRLNELYEEARAAGALVKVEGLQRAFTERMLELSAKSVTAQTVTPAQVAQTVKVGQGQRPPRNRGRGKK